MNKFIAIIVVTFSLIPSTIMAASLTIPNNVNVLVHNGKSIEVKNNLPLAIGLNQIAFRYQGSYRERGNQEQFESEVVIVNFNAKDQQYRIELPTIRNNRAENNFNKNPNVVIKSADQQVSLTLDVLLKSGLQIGRDYQDEMAQYNQMEQVASVQQFIPLTSNAINDSHATVATTTETTSIVAPTAVAIAADTANDSKAVPKTIEQDQAEIRQMLDYWYSKANEQTRAEFKQAIK
ncbi:YccT family protein [Shewanella gaetbuli]